MSTICFIAAVIIFVATALGAHIHNALYWGLGATALGLALHCTPLPGRN